MKKFFTMAALFAAGLLGINCIYYYIEVTLKPPSTTATVPVTNDAALDMR